MKQQLQTLKKSRVINICIVQPSFSAGTFPRKAVTLLWKNKLRFGDVNYMHALILFINTESFKM